MEGDGKLEIIDGGSVTSEWAWAVLGLGQNSTASAIVSGQGSSWTGMGFFLVGVGGAASVEITNGASVRSEEGNVGMDSGSTGTVTVSGAGSTWSTHFELCVGLSGEGSLAIADGGLVSVRGGLSIDSNRDGDSYLTMATGGMLALKGNAAGSLGEFLGLIDGTDDIRYWDDSVRAWADITGATAGEDYTLAYLTEGDLAGYTVLTVTAGLPTQLGDTNDDDIIDDLDLANLVAQFGSTPGDESADFNGDGFVGLEDFAILRAYLGSGVAAAAPEAESPAATPEPASAVLLLLGLGAVIRHRKK
jgi:T5SS/PEP-CTERM-associated repeat protein